MKRKHDPEKWDGLGFRGMPKVREPYRKWCARREAMFDAKEPELLAMSRFGQNRRPVDVERFDGWSGRRNQRYTKFAAVRMSDDDAMLYSPEKGFRLVKIDDYPEIRERFIDHPSPWQQLAAITRRAFIPRLVTQIYSQPP